MCNEAISEYIETENLLSLIACTLDKHNYSPR